VVVRDGALRRRSILNTVVRQPRRGELKRIPRENCVDGTVNGVRQPSLLRNTGKNLNLRHVVSEWYCSGFVFVFFSLKCFVRVNSVYYEIKVKDLRRS